MSIKKIVSILLVIIIPVVVFFVCRDEETVKYGYNGDAKISTLSSQTVAQNSNLALNWDDNAKCIVLENKKTGKWWTNVPREIYERGETCSTLDISVQDMEFYQTEFISGEEPLDSGKISCEKIENGVELTYYFDKVKIAVPVSYVLRDDSLLVTIDGAKIQEDGKKYRLVYASVSPKLCSVKQGTEEAYLFVPEGNGALMYTNVNADGHRKVEIGTANVAAHDVGSSASAPESSGMRVFGIKDKTDAMVCIAENTPGAVGIYASAGDRKSDYASVYSVFYFVDYDYFYGKASNSGAVRHLSDRYSSKISVGYYPLENENADYNGMAKKYREYLIKAGYIKENKTSISSPYSLTILGGVMTTTTVMGLPVQSLKKMTSFNEAKDIIKDITDITGEKPVIRLKGFTESGINFGEIAGGYAFASELGDDNERKALENYCKKNNIPLYSEFEMIKYSESGSGFSYSSDSAKTAILYPAEFSPVNVPLRDFNSDVKIRYLKRSKIGEAVNTLIDTIKDEKISGVSIASLGSISYSDYSENIKYGVTGRMEKDTKDYFLKIKKTGAGIAANSATYFAAGLVDTVFDAPLDVNGKLYYDVEIPFYQLVYSGVTPLYSSAVNTASIPERKIMMAASTGTGLGFTVVDYFEKSYMETAAEKLYACVYKENTQFIKSSLENYGEIYKAINGSKIESYELLENDVTKTVFENGVTVYANHSSNEVETPIGNLGKYGFGMEREGV